MGKISRITSASYPYPGPAVAHSSLTGTSCSRQAQVVVVLWNYSDENGRTTELCWIKDQLPVLSLMGVIAGSLGWSLQEEW